MKKVISSATIAAAKKEIFTWIRDLMKVWPFIVTVVTVTYAIDFLIFTFPEITLWVNYRFNNDWSPNDTTIVFQSLFGLCVFPYKIFKHQYSQRF